MNCPKCNNQNAEGSTFCSKCGTALTSENQVVESQQPNTNAQTEVRAFTGFGETISQEEPQQPAEFKPEIDSLEIPQNKQEPKKPVITAAELLSKEQPIIVNKNPYASVNLQKEFKQMDDKGLDENGYKGAYEIEQKTSIYMGDSYVLEPGVFNWWAFFLNYGYFVYHKMYKLAIICDLLKRFILLLALLFALAIKKDSMELIMALLLILVFCDYGIPAIAAANFNTLYHKQVQKTVSKLPNNKELLELKGQKNLLLGTVVFIIENFAAITTIAQYFSYL